MPSFEELLRRFQVPVLHFLQGLGPPSEAEDVLQETFLRAYSQLKRYSRRWRFSTWLFTIARRTSINYHRRALPTADIETIRRAISPLAGPEQRAAAADNRQYLWSVAERVLDKDERTALWLHYVEQTPVQEIAVVLERSAAAVKTMMFRSRQKLLPLVGELEPGGRQTRPARPVEASHG